MQGMSSWAGWLLTAVMLHPTSDELWTYTELLPHYLPTRMPLTIKYPPAPRRPPQAAEPNPRALPDEALLNSLLPKLYMAQPAPPLQTIPGQS